MLKIGDFSKLSKITIKALRYYEEKGLLVPKHVDAFSGYRYYESDQLLEVAKIVSLKQAGLSIDEIKRIIVGKEDLKKILLANRDKIKNTILDYNNQLAKLNYLLEEKNMKEEIFEKVVPGCCVYYKEGIINNYSEASKFILDSGAECMKLNPGIRCVEPDYCFVNYLDREYKEKNIKLRYAQAVVKTDKPFVQNESIKFMDIPETKCLCIYHKGPYGLLGESYGKLMKYIEDNNLEIVDYLRECYIDGAWNKEDESEWLTEIQVPIK